MKHQLERFKWDEKKYKIYKKYKTYISIYCTQVKTKRIGLKLRYFLDYHNLFPGNKTKAKKSAKYSPLPPPKKKKKNIRTQKLIMLFKSRWKRPPYALLTFFLILTFHDSNRITRPGFNKTLVFGKTFTRTLRQIDLRFLLFYVHTIWMVNNRL